MLRGRTRNYDTVTEVGTVTEPVFMTRKKITNFRVTYANIYSLLLNTFIMVLAF